MQRGKMVTANRLGDGAVVYFVEGGDWTLWIDEASVVDGKEAGEALLAAAKPFVEACAVVEPYLIDVERAETGWRAISVRERIRAAGPSMRLDLGKQAETRQR